MCAKLATTTTLGKQSREPVHLILVDGPKETRREREERGPREPW